MPVRSGARHAEGRCEVSRSVKVQSTSDRNGDETVIIQIDGKEVYRETGSLPLLVEGVSHPTIPLLALVAAVLEGGAG